MVPVSSLLHKQSTSQKPAVLPPPLPTTTDVLLPTSISTAATLSTSVRSEDDDVGNRVAAALSALALATTGPALAPMNDTQTTTSLPPATSVVLPTAAIPSVAVFDPSLLIPSSVSASFSEPLNAVQSTLNSMIPTALTLHALLPKPAKLPAVAEMSAHDLVRELTSVHCMREAETAAAIEYLETSSSVASSSFLSPSGFSSSLNGESGDIVQGTLEIRFRGEETSMPFELDGSPSGKFVNSLRLVAETCVSSTSDASVKDIKPSVAFSVEIPSSLDVSTLAFDVPRLTMTANEPTVGPAPARNALKTLKMFVAAATSSGMSSSPAFFDNMCEKRLAPIAHMRCRVFPHSELSPSQSEARVQAMLERLRALTGYEFYVPIASLAQTRLGSSHVPFMSSSSGTTSAAKNKIKRDRRIFSPLSMKGPGDTVATFASSNSSTVSFQGGVMSPQASSSTLFSPQQQTAITPSGSSSALSFVTNASRFAATTPGGPLIRPQITTATLPCSLTPPPQAQRALARFVSRYDKSRSRTIASPASFDREYHTPLLRSMQSGLDAMVGQRREEEAHMARATLVRPQKHPQGGYYYVSVETGRAVPPHDYEKVYLSEVSFATEFINTQAIEGWAAEAATRAEELAAMTPDERAILDAKEEEAKMQRIAWWDQDVEEGVVLLPTVDSTVSTASSTIQASNASPLGETIAQFVSMWLSTAKEANKKSFVAEPVSQPLESTTPLAPSTLASPVASQRCIDDTVAIVAARAAKLLLPAGAPSPSSALLTATSSSIAPSASESALWASVAAAVAIYVNSQKQQLPSIEADSHAAGTFTLSAIGLEAEIDRLLTVKEIDSNSSSSASATQNNSTVVLDVEEGADSFGPQVEAVLEDAIAAFGAANDEAQQEDEDNDRKKDASSSSSPQARVLAGISLQLLPNGASSSRIEASSAKKKSPFKSPALPSSLQEEAPLETWSPSEVEIASSTLAVKRLFTGSPMNALRSAGFKSIVEPSIDSVEVASMAHPKPFSLSLESSLFTSLEEGDGAGGSSSLTADSKGGSSSESTILSAVRIELLSFETQRDGLSPSTADDDEHSLSSTFESGSCSDEKVNTDKPTSIDVFAPASPERLPASVMRIFSPQKRVATTPSSTASNVYREYGSSSPQMSKETAAFNSAADLVLPSITLLPTFNGSSAAVTVTASTPPPPPAPTARSIAAVRLQPLVSPISTAFSQRAATAISTIIFDDNFVSPGTRITLPEVRSTLKPVASPINVSGALAASSKVSSPDLLFFPQENLTVKPTTRQSPRPLSE